MMATPTLAQQQQALLGALLASGPGAAAETTEFIANYAMKTRPRGLNVYQSNAHALAERSLSAAYPVVAQLVGDESFAHLACALWHAHPPTAGDMAQWGEALPTFISDQPQLAEVPYLADVARVEWALHQSATAADWAPDWPSLQRLVSQDPTTLCLHLAPGLAVVDSPWPVVSIVLAHVPTYALPSVAPQESGPVDLTEAGERVRHQLAESALVWRQGFTPRVRQALPGEAAFVQALHQGLVLAHALDHSPDLDVSAWLPLAVSSGLLLQASDRADHAPLTPLFPTP